MTIRQGGYTTVWLMAQYELTPKLTLAGELHFDALRFGLDAFVVRVEAQVAHLLRGVGLLRFEHRAGQIRLAAEQFAFQAQLIRFAFDRRQRLAVGVDLALRIENRRVAAVRRQNGVNRIHQSHVRRGLGGGPVAAHAVADARSIDLGVVGAGQQLDVVGQVPAHGLSAGA